MRRVDAGDKKYMNCHNENVAVPNPLVRLMTWLTLALLGAPALAVDSGDIVVSSVKGEVRVTMNGAVRDVRAGSVLELPATVRTGRDGAIDLKQGATSVSVGPDTELEFPALEKRGAPVDRIVQPRGNAFYDIGKREGRKLRVETPYLVGVIKGTQFNVAVQDDSATISLFEGRLEILGGEDGGVVDLRAGEIAARRRGDKSISVTGMNEKAPAAAPVSQNQRGGNGSSHGGTDGGQSPLRGETAGSMPGAADVSADFGNAVRVDAALGAPEVALVVDTGVSASIDLGGAAVSVDAGLSAGADVGSAVSVDPGVSASVDVGAGAVSVDTGLSTGVDLGTAVSVDIGANTSVDVGGNGLNVDVATASDLAVGGVTTAIDTGAGVDLGTVGVSVDVDAGVVAGAGDVAAVDAGVDLATNVGPGAIDVGTAVDVGANVAGVDAGVSAGVDAGAGAIDLGLTVGSIDVGLGIDLGLDGDDANENGNEPVLDDTNNPAGPAPATPGNIIDDVGGLLDGLLRRPGRR
jgi:hypothetical protein